MLIQTIFGILGGIGPEAENLMHMRRIADHLFGNDFHWSILGAGRHQMGLLTMGAIMGGHCRVGIEDSIYLRKGELAQSNAQQVGKIRTILNEMSLEIATPDEARKMLGLKARKTSAFDDPVRRNERPNRPGRRTVLKAARSRTRDLHVRQWH